MNFLIITDNVSQRVTINYILNVAFLNSNHECIIDDSCVAKRLTQELIKIFKKKSKRENK